MLIHYPHFYDKFYESLFMNEAFFIGMLMIKIIHEFYGIDKIINPFPKLNHYVYDLGDWASNIVCCIQPYSSKWF